MPQPAGSERLQEVEKEAMQARDEAAKEADEVAKQAEALAEEAAKKSMKQMKALAVATISVAVWLFTGAVVYWAVGNCSQVARFQNGKIVAGFELCPWHFSHAIYFSVQTGMSIGFGLLSESESISKVYSIFHILAGSSVIGGALSFFVQQALEKHHDFLSESEKRLIEASVKLHADGYKKGFTTEQLRKLMVMYPQYANDIIRKLHPDSGDAQELIDKFRRASKKNRFVLAADILKEASTTLPQFQHDGLRIEDLVDLDEENASIRRKILRAIRARSTFIKSFSGLLICLIIGTLFSFYADENDFVTSLYFAVSTLSTAGMVATTTVKDDSHVIFVAIYSIIGVPIYCVTLGAFANVLVERYTERQTQERLSGKLSMAEIEFLGHINVSTGEEVNLCEYTEFQLLRLGVVDRQMLDQIRRQFEKLDTNGSGTILKTDFLHAHHIEPVQEVHTGVSPTLAGNASTKDFFTQEDEETNSAVQNEDSV